MKKGTVLALVLVAALSVSLTACGENGAPGKSGSENTTPPAPTLQLPEQYAVSYQVTEGVEGVSRSYEQSMTQTAEGIYLELNDLAVTERYVFEKQENGEYLFYQYDPIRKLYVLTSAVQANPNSGEIKLDEVTVDAAAVAGYTVRVSACCGFYETFRENMQYQGEETVNGFNYQKYEAALETSAGKQSVTLWVEPDYGLCVKADYRLEPAMGVTSSKTIECTAFSTDAPALPEYK